MRGVVGDWGCDVKYILPISFGNDSTAMANKILESGMPVDYILFYDTLMEFDDMYKYKDKVTQYLKRKYNRDIIVLKPMTTFEEWCFGVIRDKTADKYGYIRGIPNDLMGGVCYWKRESKVKPFDKWAKETLDEDFTVYIGYTKNEQSRKYKNETEIIKNIHDKELTKTYTYPLMYDFKMSGNDCKKFLVENEMENPLYKHFTRTGCGTCHNQSERSWFNVWKYYPSVWEYMKWIEKRLEYYESKGMKVANKYWFIGQKTCEDMEFKFEMNKNTIFDFSDDPVKDCFCKI